MKAGRHFYNMAAPTKPEKAFLKAVGDNIRHYRQEKVYTLEQLGEDIGLDKGNLHRIEQGKNITLLTLLKIAVFLDEDPQRLISTDIAVSQKEMDEYVARKKRG